METTKSLTDQERMFKLAVSLSASGTTMRIQLLLNKDYIPYWKWLTYAFRKLPGVEIYVAQLESLHATDDISQKVRIVQEICREIHQQMLSMGIVSGKGVHEYAKLLLPLVKDHDEFMQKASWMSE
jgi:hypothetical protein